MKQQQEQVLRSVAQEDIRLIRLWFTDVAGVLKSVSIDPGELEEAFSEGIGFDGSSIEGLTRVYESDMLLHPDAATFQRLHTKDGTDVHGRMLCDVLTPDGLQPIPEARSSERFSVPRRWASQSSPTRRLSFTFFVSRLISIIWNRLTKRAISIM